MRAFRVLLTAAAFAGTFVGMITISAFATSALHSALSTRPSVTPSSN